MAKNLQDIIDEGFTRLEGLAQQRQEILTRAEKIVEDAAGSQGELVENKIKQIESNLLADISSKSDQIQTELNRTFDTEFDSKHQFVRNNMENLRIRILSALSDLDQLKSGIMDRTAERLDALFSELKIESESASESISSEVQHLISELDSICMGYKGALHKSQTEAEDRISEQFEKSSVTWSELHNETMESVKKKRNEAEAKISDTNKEHLEKWNTAIERPSAHLAPHLKAQFENIKQAAAAEKSAIDKMSDELIASASDGLKSAGMPAFKSLDDMHHSCHTDVSEKLQGLKKLQEQMLVEQQTSLSERDREVRNKVYRLYFDLILIENTPVEQRSQLDSSFFETSAELTVLTEDLRSKLDDVLKSQTEVLSNLTSAANRALSNLLADYKTQLSDLVKQEEHLCIRREDELLQQLQGLEERVKKASDSYSGMGGGTR